MEKVDLVRIDEYDLLGSNFYWNKYESKGLSRQDVIDSGQTGDYVEVHRDIIEILQKIDKKFKLDKGCRLFIKEGYRSKALYEIVYKRRCEKFGKSETDRLLNMKDMPHSLGLSIDVTMWDPQTDKEVYFRNGDDGADALFVDFYQNKTDEKSMYYQDLQEYLINTMQDYGFRLGKLREYFHFDYRPNEPRNYPGE